MAAWPSQDGSAGLPDQFNAKFAKCAVGCDERNLFKAGLRSKQPIKWISVSCRRRSTQMSVRDRDRQRLQSMRLDVTVNAVGNSLSGRPLSDPAFWLSAPK
jgi:hypothetical protein